MLAYNYSDYRGNKFHEAHAFIGYQKDTPAAVIFQATNHLRKLQENHGQEASTDAEHLMRAGIITLNFADVSQDSDLWIEAVSHLNLVACVSNKPFVATKHVPVVNKMRLHNVVI